MRKLLLISILVFLHSMSLFISSVKALTPLHVEGKYIKNSYNMTVYLYGVWVGWFADTSTGWFGLDLTKWDEAALRETLQKLRDVWGANVINFYTWGDWWLENKAITLGGAPTDIGLRDAIIRTVQIASEYGIYVQFRLYSPSRAEGRREGQPYQPTYSWTVQDFVNFWVNVTSTLKDYPNVIYTLFDEPTGNQTTWFDAASQAINAIRATGSDQLIVVHWGYCSANVKWIADWVNGGYPTYNIVFSTHIYRFHGTFGPANSPVDIDYIRNWLNRTILERNVIGYKYVMDTYNVPIWTSAIGAYNGATDEAEYIYFRNTLQVLNEWGIGYVAFHASRTALAWTVLQNPTMEVFSAPNRVGQALIDAIAGIPPLPTHNFTINSNVTVLFDLVDGGLTRKYTTPYTATFFEGQYTIAMPPSVTVYTHDPLFGSTDNTLKGLALTTYIYATGPYTLNSSAKVSQIYLYTYKAGKVRVAIYDSIERAGKLQPNNKIVESSEHDCVANAWNSVTIPTVELSPGNYFFAIKINTNGMLAGKSVPWFSWYISSIYTQPFPDIFVAQGASDDKLAVYVARSPTKTETYNFKQWENGLVNPQRTINLTADTTLTGTYELSIPIEKKITISERLTDVNGSPVMANISIGSITNATDSEGKYILTIPLGVHDILFNIVNFFIENFWIKLLAVNISSTSYNKLTHITNFTEQKNISLIFNITKNQTILTYSPEKPNRVLKNSTLLKEYNSSSELIANYGWSYNKTEKILYINFNETV